MPWRLGKRDGTGTGTGTRNEKLFWARPHAFLTRGVHRTLTPRSQTLFHRLGTIPVEWE